MTATNIDADLDALAPAPKRVRLGGKVYKIPGDMPLELYFKLNRLESQLGDDEGNEEAVIGELRDLLLGLFQELQPDLKKLPDSTGILQVLGAIGAIYRPPASAEEKAAPNRAARRAQTGRTKSAPRGNARARSRAG